MKGLALMVLSLFLTVQGHGYDPTETKIIKGVNGNDYKVIISESKKLYETHIPPKEQMIIVQHLNQPRFRKDVHVAQQPLTPQYAYPQPILNGNAQQAFNSQQQHSNFNAQQYNGAAAAVGEAKNYYNQFTAHSSYGQHNDIRQQQQKQQQEEQHSHYPQQYVYKPIQQSPCQSNLPNDLSNNHKYVSQSEASQLDATVYKQINGNPRQFTRTIIKCDASGQCEPQNVAGCGSVGVSDFHHQQVLKQSKAQLQPAADNNGSKSNNQFTANALTGSAAKALRDVPIFKGTDLRDRRLFPYSEMLANQYPHN